MLLNFSKNCESDIQRAKALFARNRRPAAIPDGLEERFDFQAQRLVFGHRERLKSDLLAARNRERHCLLLLIIERDVLMRLKEPQLADALGGDAASSEVGDTAARKGEAYVGDVDLVRKDRNAGRANLFRHRSNQI